MAVLGINPQKIVAYTQDVLDAIAGIDVTQDVLDVIAGIDVSWNDLTDKPIIAAISDVNAAPTAEDFNALLSALRAAGLMELGDSGTTEDTETTGYFDITSAAGFTMRIYYSEINKIVTITDIKLQSTVYKGMWYPHGAIKVNNITVFEMDYWAPATHVFNVNSAGDSWFDLQVQTGKSLPVSSEVLSTKEAVISANIEMYRSDEDENMQLSGSTTINL